MDDEYTMTWSDAAAVEAAFLALERGEPAAAPRPEYGTLGTRLWQLRCAVRLLALNPSASVRDAEAVVARLSAHRRWLELEPRAAAAQICLQGAAVSASGRSGPRTPTWESH